ncbi:hypothetical protein VP01_4658g1, partial [Puccinia sorghi]
DPPQRVFQVARKSKGIFFDSVANIHKQTQAKPLKPLRNSSLPSIHVNLHSHLTTSMIPLSNSAFACSMQDFTRILFGVEATHTNFPSSPPQSQLSNYHQGSEIVFASKISLTRFHACLSENPLDCLEFVKDLAARDVHHVSFAWDELPSSTYNQWFSNMVVKHWTFTKNNCLLHKYAIAPANDTTSNTHKLLYRWLQGLQEDLGQTACNPHWSLVLSQPKIKLSNHLVDNFVALSFPPNIVQIFMDPRCTSKTEEENQEKFLHMYLPWQSQELTNASNLLS